MQHNSHALVPRVQNFRVRRIECTSRRITRRKIEEVVILNGSFQYLSTDDRLRRRDARDICHHCWDNPAVAAAIVGRDYARRRWHVGRSTRAPGSRIYSWPH